jgi:hypothetical protein
MNKHLIVIGIIILLLAVGLSGCTDTQSSDIDKLIGTWFDEETEIISITFFSDGNCDYGGINSTWELKDGEIVIEFLNQDYIKTFDYIFSDNSNKLTLIQSGGDEGLIFTRQ